MTHETALPGASTAGSRRGITLETYIFEGMMGAPGASGYFTSLLNQIGLAAKLINARVRSAGLSEALGYTGHTNVQGEQVQKLDLIANDTLVAVLRHRGHCAALCSEEEETLQVVSDDPRARYIVLFDPLDGSSNIDVNISIGTIFGILRRPKGDTHRPTEADVLRPGRELVAAGYVMYGSSTLLVMTLGEGVHGFTYDPEVGEFFLSHENIRCPPRGSIYSINEGNAGSWSEGISRWVSWAKEHDAASHRPYGQRYVGTLVADAHRTLFKGGVFVYPADARTPSGKLRLLYEANPFAFLFEAAGGAASDGRRRILDLEPTQLHQRTPLVIGSREEVAIVEGFLRDGGV